MSDEQKTEPVRLPLTKQQAMDIFDRWWARPGAFMAGNLFDDLGITFAPEPPAPPERKWPAKLEAVKLYSHWKCMAADDEDWWFTVSHTRLEDEELTQELARRWNRCEELEQEIRDGWRPADQQNQQALERQRLRIDALLAELRERTEERDVALGNAVTAQGREGRLMEELRLERSNHGNTRGVLAEVTQERDAAREGRRAWEERAAERLRTADHLQAERDEARAELADHQTGLQCWAEESHKLRAERDKLRRRCAWAGRVIDAGGSLWTAGHAAVLRGARPVPGEGGGDGS